jgi:hypothetical protein
MGQVLWSLQELAKRVGVTPRFAFKKLPPPVATLKNGEANWYLWREIQLMQFRKDISSGKVRVPVRSLRGPKFGVHFSPARHFLADDQQAENSRIAKHRSEPAFWSKLI